MKLLNIEIKRGIYFILYLTIIFCNQTENNQNNMLRCGNDKFKPIPVPLNSVAPLNKKNLKYKRTLDSDGFKEFNIFLDLKNFDDEIKKYNLENKRELYVKGMQKAIKTLQSLLKIKEPKNYVFNDEDLRDILIFYWDKKKLEVKMLKKI